MVYSDTAQGEENNGQWIPNDESKDRPVFEEESVYGPSRILEEIDFEKLDKEGKNCLEKTREFCHETTDAFRLKFLSSLVKERKEGAPISQEIRDAIIEKEFDLPLFTIINGEKAKQFIKNTNCYYNDLDSDEFLLIFQLPKPLSHFWWKGGIGSWGENAVDIHGTFIEWGKLYRKIMPVVWNKIGFYENEKELDFWRLNEVGEHDPDKFYYIWKMRKWEKY